MTEGRGHINYVGDSDIGILMKKEKEMHRKRLGTNRLICELILYTQYIELHYQEAASYAYVEQYHRAKKYLR